jgi:hypothetical protein
LISSNAAAARVEGNPRNRISPPNRPRRASTHFDVPAPCPAPAMSSTPGQWRSGRTVPIICCSGSLCLSSAMWARLGLSARLYS